MSRRMTTVGRPTQAHSFVGRADELMQLEQLIREGEHAVVYLHGIPGIGKSSLVRRLLEQLRTAEHAGVQLDCRTVEPTQRGLFAALGTDGLETFVERLSATPTVIALDHYEVFRLMDTWLRQVFVPALPHGTCVLLSGSRAARRGVVLDRRLPDASRSGPMTAEDAALLLQAFDIGACRGAADQPDRPRPSPRSHSRRRGNPRATSAELEEAATRPVIDDAGAALSRGRRRPARAESPGSSLGRAAHDRATPRRDARRRRRRRCRSTACSHLPIRGRGS